MKYKEWIFLLSLVCIAIITTNFVAYKVPVTESIIGVVVLAVISLIAVFISKVVPINLPMILFCSLLGLLFAMPASPISGFVTEAADKIEFKAPLSIVGALAGISIGASFHDFKRQGLKMFIIAIIIMTSTFIGSAVIAQLSLKFTGGI